MFDPNPIHASGFGVRTVIYTGSPAGSFARNLRNSAKDVYFCSHNVLDEYSFPQLVEQRLHVAKSIAGDSVNEYLISHIDGNGLTFTKNLGDPDKLTILISERSDLFKIYELGYSELAVTDILTRKEYVERLHAIHEFTGFGLEPSLIVSPDYFDRAYRR